MKGRERVEGVEMKVWEVGGAGRPANFTPPPVFKPFPPEKLCEVFKFVNLGREASPA